MYKSVYSGNLSQNDIDKIVNELCFSQNLVTEVMEEMA